jgi:hypothetical protein
MKDERGAVSGRSLRGLMPGRNRSRELTQGQMALMLVFGIVGAIVATCAGLIVLAIFVGLADGH